MSDLRIGGLCFGYGGLDMGVQSVIGGELAWVSEIDKGACKIIDHRYPDVPNIGDMTTVDWSQVEPVDVLTGGTPCQDLSHAGKRKGMTEGTRSNLWVAMREAIAQLRPALVVWENVRGAYSAAADSALESCAGCVGDGSGVHLRALGRVLGDLSDLGYDCRWHGLRAADVGAPHGRFRVFVVAYAIGGGRDGWTPDAFGSQVVGATTAGRCEGALLPGHLDWGDYADAIARWEHLTRPAPAPTMQSKKGTPQLSPAFSEWMMGLPAGWVTDVPDVTRNEALRALGNGVVPQQAEAALRFLLNVQAVAA